MAVKMLLCVYLFLNILPDSTPASIVNLELSTNTTEQPEPAQCPCLDQPEGVMMPHPTDCRAYYICVGASNVHYTRCGAGDQFFHPYLRSCVQRSKYLFFVPNIVDTKDLCKINSVFRTPAAENFDNCHIESDGDITPTSNSIEDSHSNSNSVNALFTSAPNIESVGFPWFNTTTTTTSTTIKPRALNFNSSLPTGWNFMTAELPETISSTTTTVAPTTPLTTPSPSLDCRISKVLVHHFPGPCKADITCESGASFTVNQCLNTLTFISQFTPSSRSN